MFTNRLIKPANTDYRVVYSPYAQRHFLKSFEKNYKGKQWLVTQQSIFEQLKRVDTIQDTQQVDELKSGKTCLLFKYDFAVAKTHVSAKASGNRCIIYLDIPASLLTVLMIYAKTDLPKNQGETQWIMQTVQAEFSELYKALYLH